MLVHPCWFRVAKIVTFIVVFATACDAHAGWNHKNRAAAGGSSGGGSSGGGSSGGGSSGGGSSGGGSSGGGSSGGSYSSAGSTGGSSGGSRRASRHAMHNSSHGSSGGSYGGSSGGSSGGSYGGSSGGSSGGYASPAYSLGYSPVSGMSSSMPVESYRVINEAPAASGTETIVAPPAIAPAATDATLLDMRIPADAALLIVELPATGKIFVNGAKTSATGSLRRFVSRGLTEGKNYEFVVRIIVDRNGSTTEETQVVSLSAGTREMISFNAKQPIDDLVMIPAVGAAPKTSLTLHVPADSKVWLAGNETASTGNVRQFETQNLQDGQTWKGYEIRVVMVEKGNEKMVSKIIDLVAGGSVELSLDPSQQTASTGATASLR